MTIEYDIYIALESVKQAFEDRSQPAGSKHVIVSVNYPHIDCPEHAEYVREMITGTQSPPVLIVSAADGPFPLTARFNDQEKLMEMLDMAQETSFAQPMRIDLLPDTAPDFSGADIPAPKKIKPHYREHDYRGKHPMLRR